MISRTQGDFELPASSAAGTKAGSWTYTPASDTAGTLRDDAADLVVGRFAYAPISEDAGLFRGLFSWEAELCPTKPLRCIGVTNSEIMKHIQLPGSKGAYFVLPSQLNGAEYPSETYVVRRIKDYRSDNTGGPRGQLAVHPAAGQFVLDNAAHGDNPKGLNAVDQILEAAKAFQMQNGYLKLPAAVGDEDARGKFDRFREELHTLRPLVMHDVPASGLTPDKKSFSGQEHRVGLVYASAVPVDAYLNYAGTLHERKLHQKVAEAVLVAQYYGALYAAAAEQKEQQQEEGGGRRAKTKVFLLPLGGGVFNNPWQSIARAMAQAVELLAEKEPELFKAVEVEALAWEGSPSERTLLETLLREYGKLREEREEVEAAEAQPLPVAPLPPPALSPEGAVAFSLSLAAAAERSDGKGIAPSAAAAAAPAPPVAGEDEGSPLGFAGIVGASTATPLAPSPAPADNRPQQPSWPVLAVSIGGPVLGATGLALGGLETAAAVMVGASGLLVGVGVAAYKRFLGDRQPDARASNENDLLRGEP